MTWLAESLPRVEGPAADCSGRGRAQRDALPSNMLKVIKLTFVGSVVGIPEVPCCGRWSDCCVGWKTGRWREEDKDIASRIGLLRIGGTVCAFEHLYFWINRVFVVA